MYADDTLLFYEANHDHLAFLSWLLMWFDALLGVSINLSKNKIFLVGRIENAEVLALELGCKVGTLPSSYLGLPLGALHNSVGFGTPLRRGSRRGW